MEEYIIPRICTIMRDKSITLIHAFLMGTYAFIFKILIPREE